MKKIIVLIPCHNEEKGIAQVIHGVPKELLLQRGFITDILVIDNNSSDNTSKIAKETGADVLFVTSKGKGNAVKEGFLSIKKDVDYIVMLDGDDTYKSFEIPRLIEPLDSGFCDVIVGSRMGGKTMKGSFKLQNRIANWIYAFMVRFAYKANVTDVLSGFFALRRETLDHLKLYLNSDGFAIEMEMITKLVKMGYGIYSVPITYDVRQGESKIDTIKDGTRILRMFFQNLFWKPGKSGSKKLLIKIGMRVF
jgi:glycosyltransferase involved in cell wall biosynthesis